jgi:hypothetical protein
LAKKYGRSLKLLVTISSRPSPSKSATAALRELRAAGLPEMS